MTTVAALLKEKGPGVFTTTPETTVYEALKTLAEKNVGALLVMEGDRAVGMFSERDYARKIALLGRTSLDTPVREVMTTFLYCVRPDTTDEECMALMTEKRIRHLPVLEGEKVIGLVSIGDIVKSLIDGQQRIIKNLQDYVMGKYL